MSSVQKESQAIPGLRPVVSSQSARRRSREIGLAIVIAAMAVVPILAGSRFIFHVSSMVAIMGSLALGLNLMLRMGQLSIGQAAFAGLGAYCSALLTLRLGWSGLSAFLASGIGVGLFALVAGPIFVRVKGVYFVLLTFAFTQVVNLLFQRWTDLFGGNNGLYGIPKLQGLGLRLATPLALYLGALGLLLITLGMVTLIYRSYIGQVIDSLNEDEELCRSLGVHAMAWRVLIFAISAMLAGFAGSYYAHFIGFLSPDAFRFSLSVDLLVMNVVGGVSSAFGPVVGSILLASLPELLRSARQFQMLGYGLTLIAFMLFFRTGITGFLLRRR